METQEFLKPALSGLAKLHINLHNTGGVANDGNLFEQILSIQERILNSSGLPNTPENEKLLWFKSLPSEQELNARIEQLHKRASEYLLSHAKSELQILRNAQEENGDPFYILPELKIPTHVYTLFIYNEILLKRKDSVENILHELKIASHPNVLNATGHLMQGKVKNEKEIISMFKESGFRYIEQFINSKL